MLYFKKPSNKRVIASILIICIVSLTAGSFLLYPRKTQADDDDWANIMLNTLEQVWNVLKTIWRAAMKGYEAIQAAIDKWTKSKKLHEWALGVLLNTLLHRLLAQITNNIIAWVQDGSTPRFLSGDLDDWIRDAIDITGGIFVNQYLGAGWLCEPFDLEVQIPLLDVPSFTDEIQCTLPDVVTNI
ncbi:MAG: hypothetical protein CMI55_04720, partial [Parcubacteria group bacterium]|nr:hypothetical protein [Parcubacteria group bacterium]